MKKLGQISDANLLKKAAGNVKAEAGLKTLVQSKIAMFSALIDAAEKISFTRMTKEAKAALIESACSYMPAAQMLEPYEKVVKQAQVLLTRLTAEGIKRQGDAIIDKKATAVLQKKKAELILRKKAAGGIDNVEGDGILQSLYGADIETTETGDTLNQNELAQGLYDDSFQGKPSDDIYNVGEIPIEDIMQMLADNNAGLTEDPGLNNPYPDIFDITGETKMGSADPEQLLMSVLKKADAYISKLAEVSTELPQGDSGSNAEATEKEFNKDVDTKPEVAGNSTMDAGASMDDIAEVTELETLLAETGALGEDQTNKVTSANPAETPKAENKVASGTNVFKSVMKKINR